MTEPTLTYKKGEGWVYESFETVETTDREGKAVQLERRQPKPGEPYFIGYSDMAQNVRHINKFRVNQFVKLWDTDRLGEYRDVITIVTL